MMRAGQDDRNAGAGGELSFRQSIYLEAIDLPTFFGEA